MSLIKWEMLDGNVENAEVWGRTIGAIYHDDNKMEFMCETYMSADKELFLEFWDEWFLRSIGRKEEDCEILKIQGYTEKQWKEFVGKDYLCEFSRDGEEWLIGELSSFDCFHDGETVAFHIKTDVGGAFSLCRPAVLKGIERPIFVEPISEESWCVFLNNGKYSTYERRWHTKGAATSYIELNV